MRKNNTQKSISRRTTQGKWFAALFCSVFFFVGCAIFYFLCIRPLTKVHEAKSWIEVPCRIISSEVGSHSDSDGTTYSVNIHYSYELNARQFKSKKYDFLGGSSSGYKGKKQIVDQYPPGSERICYVNPEKLHEAVINREFSPTMLMVGGFSLVFVFAGLGGIYFSLKKNKKGKHSWIPKARGIEGARAYPEDAPYGLAPSGPVELKPLTGPLGRLIGVLIFGLIWNGIIVIVAFNAGNGWPDKSTGFFKAFFSLPLGIFTGIGLLIIAGAVYFLLAVFNPVPHITVSSSNVSLGSTMDLEWRLQGRAERIRHFQVFLEGREEATYQRGTNTYTDKNTFLTLMVADSTDFFSFRSGRQSVHIPEDTMHSFESSNNKIVWSLNVKGDIPFWPDVRESFDVVILPEKIKV